MSSGSKKRKINSVEEVKNKEEGTHSGKMSTTKEVSKVYLITGASRVIGLEFVRQLSEVEGNLIFATARNPDSATDLKALQAKSHGRIEIVPLDVADQKSIQAAGEAVKAKTKKLDVLINNAGINSAEGTTLDPSEKSTTISLKFEPAPKTSAKNLLEVFQTNLIGVHVVTQTFLPLLDAAKKESKDGKVDSKSTDVPKVINITSGFASIGNNKGGFTAYRASKGALNMLTVNWAHDYPGIVFIAQAPGWVDTDMGRGVGKPTLRPEDSIKGMLDIAHKATLETSGKIFVPHWGNFTMVKKKLF